MAKPLVFSFNGNELAFQMSKVDRAKLYGYKELEVLDDEGHKCELATLAGDGRTVVGRGGTGIGYISQDGSWCDRADLKPVDLEGNEITPVPSSFSAPVPLVNRVSIDEYLEHNIRSIYVMESEDDVASLVDELKGGVIFKFDYSFRGGLEADAGFLLADDSGNVFFAVGSPTSVEFVGIQEVAGVVAEDDAAADDDEGDLMDFGMI
jgi:hypothetical protein